MYVITYTRKVLRRVKVTLRERCRLAVKKWKDGKTERQKEQSEIYTRTKRIDGRSDGQSILYGCHRSLTGETIKNLTNHFTGMMKSGFFDFTSLM